MQQRLFTEPVQIVVRTGTGSIIYDNDLRTRRALEGWLPDFSDEIDRIDRIPREHAGWKSVRYKKRRYQLFGGIRTAFFICLNSPI